MNDEHKKKHDMNSDLGALRSAVEALGSLLNDDQDLALLMIKLMQEKLTKMKENLKGQT